MNRPTMKVTALIEASGSTLTIADLRAFVDATDTLPEETVITASAGDSQKDGPWWRLIALACITSLLYDEAGDDDGVRGFDPTTSRVPS